MKLLIVLAVIALVLWLVRSGRRTSVPGRGAAKPPPALEEMVSCARCGLHLPRSEALPGRGGLFCSAVHRAEHEREHAA